MELIPYGDLTEFMFQLAIEQFIGEFGKPPNALRCGKHAMFIGCRMFEAGTRWAACEVYDTKFRIQYDSSFKDDEWQVECEDAVVHSLGA